MWPGVGVLRFPYWHAYTKALHILLALLRLNVCFHVNNYNFQFQTHVGQLALYSYTSMPGQQNEYIWHPSCYTEEYAWFAYTLPVITSHVFWLYTSLITGWVHCNCFHLFSDGITRVRIAIYNQPHYKVRVSYSYHVRVLLKRN